MYVKFIYCTTNPDAYEGLELGGRHLPEIWALIHGLKKTNVGYAREYMNLKPTWVLTVKYGLGYACSIRTFVI